MLSITPTSTTFRSAFQLQIALPLPLLLSGLDALALTIKPSFSRPRASLLLTPFFHYSSSACSISYLTGDGYVITLSFPVDVRRMPPPPPPAPPSSPLSKGLLGIRLSLPVPNPKPSSKLGAKNLFFVFTRSQFTLFGSTGEREALTGESNWLSFGLRFSLT